MTTIKWTVRGIPIETADAVREVACETATTLGQIVVLCVKFGLPEARRYLDEASIGTGECRDILERLKQIARESSASFPPPDVENNGSEPNLDDSDPVEPR